MSRHGFGMVVLVATLLLTSCSFGQASTPTPVIEDTFAPPPPLVIADGRVVPARSVEVQFALPGTVAEVLVSEGETVEPGAPLARLETAELEAAVEQARAVLDEAQAQYELLREPARPEAIAAAEAQLAQAQAAERQTAGRVTAADLQAARDELREAQALLARLLAGPNRSELTQAEAAVAQAQANLQAQRDALAAAKLAAEVRVTQAANALRDLQDAYSRIVWENKDLREQAERQGETLAQARQDAEAAAFRAVANGEAALEEARVALEHAMQAERTGIEAATAQLRELEARRDRLLAGAENDQIAGARARVSAAQARLAQLSGTARAGELEAAQAGVEQAEAGLQQVLADPSTPAIAAAEARVRASQANLRLAELALAKATLTAPFAATVVTINLEPGEQPSATLPAFVLADLTSWKIETSDLTELDIVAVREGDTVALSFDALPELNLVGVISQIEAMGKTYQGDVIYTVTIVPQTWDPRLRWNMTATMTLEG
ncbi:HlyD family efflux transporter periplasmic adaptor subunit [Candidatus Chloroploca mongolica]|nr:biotin/lipoyl-binding protein [Candidatus Chloroploca mongolica]